MKKYIFGFLVTLSFSFSFAQNKPTTEEKEKTLMRNFLYASMNWHYNSVNLNNEYSKKVFNNYLEYLDGQKRYFLQSDIDEFKKYETTLADNLMSGETTFFNITYSRLLKRLEQAEVYFQEIIKKPFIFSKKEYINLDFETLPFENTEKNLKIRWKNVLKYSFLTNYTEKASEELKKKEKNPKYKPKNKKTLEKEAKQITEKIFNEWFVSLKEMPREEWFAVFLNSYAEALDPHSNYLAPNIKQEFDSNTSGKFEGIGAGLKRTPNGVEITDIPAGSPVWKTKALEVGDLIIEVAQGNDPAVNVVGMRLQDVTKLIKGPKGTEVKLTIKRKDSSIEVVSIIRDVISIEETFAKTTLIKQNNKTFALIKLPSFYVNPNDYKDRNAASDIAKEITKLNDLNSDGLIIDLRDNSGGSLKAVVDIAGYFIKDGPIVQIKNPNNSVQIFKDSDPNIRWEKPLIILVNEASASASEILSAAMQDYGRAIIIGSKQTYGKGTAQVVFNMNEFDTNANFDMGATKLTVQKFYRINGNSNQLEGVKSNIVIPDKQMYMEIGERKAKNPLPSDNIKPANFTKWHINYQSAIEKSQQRIQDNKTFKIIDENAKWQKQKKEQKKILLTFEAFKNKQLLDEKYNKNVKDILNIPTGIHFTAMPQEQNEMKTNEDLKIRRTRWFETLEKDPYVEEAVKVLLDITQNL